MKTSTRNTLSHLMLALLLAGIVPLAAAQESAPAASSPAPAAAELTDGEVRKIDRDAGKITLRHGAIRNLDMPPMTMVLRVREATMLDGLGIGDKVRFAAERIEGAITVVRIEKAQ